MYSRMARLNFTAVLSLEVYTILKRYPNMSQHIQNLILDYEKAKNQTQAEDQPAPTMEKKKETSSDDLLAQRMDEEKKEKQRQEMLQRCYFCHKERWNTVGPIALCCDHLGMDVKNPCYEEFKRNAAIKTEEDDRRRIVIKW